MEEIWKDIDGYAGLYQISNFGNLKSIKNGNNKLIKLQKYQRYYRNNLWKNGAYQTFSIHRLVAKAFIPNPNNYPVVNHIDGNKLNNNVNNLEWCTQSHNCKESHRLGLQIPGINSHKFPKGMIPYNVKKISQYDLDGNFIKTWDTIKSAAISLNNGKYTSSISLCLSGKSKTAFGFIWRYAD